MFTANTSPDITTVNKSYGYHPITQDETRISNYKEILHLEEDTDWGRDSRKTCSSYSSSSNILCFRPSGSSYWSLLTTQMNRSHAPAPRRIDRNRRRMVVHIQAFPFRSRREFPTTTRELIAMSPAETMGCSLPVTARGIAIAL